MHIAQHGAGAGETPPKKTDTLLRDESLNSSKSRSRSQSPAPSSASAVVAPMKIDVALKMIPKKKVKGNEASVWGEMEVLKGLDHPNIVRGLLSISDITL